MKRNPRRSCYIAATALAVVAAPLWGADRQQPVGKPSTGQAAPDQNNQAGTRTQQSATQQTAPRQSSPGQATSNQEQAAPTQSQNKPQAQADTKPGATTQQANAQSQGRVAQQMHTGDRWVVETRTLQAQARTAPPQQDQRVPVQWEFRVVGVERLDDQDCVLVEVRCLVQGRRQPGSRFWVDQRTSTLRQVETQLPVQGKFRTIVEKYETTAGRPSPVFGPLTALPIDLPTFVRDQSKGAEQFSYVAKSFTPGTKDVGDQGFVFDVRQEITVADPTRTKGLVPNALTKDPQERPVTEVRLSNGERKVRQLWRADLPWPVYSDNGSTESRLVKMIPADSTNQGVKP